MSLLLGRLRRRDVQHRRRREEREGRHHPHRGRPDHPVNRGTLCPKGAGLLGFVHSSNRLRYPQYRAPGSSEWKRISWEEALDRTAKLMKADRDANFVAKTSDGKTVNRWLTTGLLAASASSNEAGYLTHKFARSLGILVLDNQARI